MSDGDDVIVFDNLSRPGVERNLRWLASRHGSRLHSVAGDIRDPDAAGAVVRTPAPCSISRHKSR